jgi:hypothetical protein
MAVVNEDPAEIEAFGRKVASSFPGFDPSVPGFEAYRYGRIARYSVGRGKGVPDPREYVSGGVPEPPPRAHRQVVDEGRRVRIGRVEMRLSDAEPARNRPQHPRHASQRSSGRYRFRLTRRSSRPRYRRR